MRVLVPVCLALTLTAAAPARPPVLVELFQSEGCSSCPPAEANLNAIAGTPGVIALSFGVTYWDRLGWKDTVARPEYTARQWDYARANRRGNVATPQMWVNGRTTTVGSNAAQLAASVAGAKNSGPPLTIGAGAVHVPAAAAPPGGADLWIARYDPRTVQVPIRAGENAGHTLPHRNTVRQLVKIGHWNGRAARLAVPPAAPGLRTAAFLQAGSGGPILAAATD